MPGSWCSQASSQQLTSGAIGVWKPPTLQWNEPWGITYTAELSWVRLRLLFTGPCLQPQPCMAPSLFLDHFLHFLTGLPLCLYNAGDASSILRSVRSPGGGHGSLLQYSRLENPMGRGAWWAMIHVVVNRHNWSNWSHTYFLTRFFLINHYHWIHHLRTFFWGMQLS